MRACPAFGGPGGLRQRKSAAKKGLLVQVKGEYLHELEPGSWRLNLRYGILGGVWQDWSQWRGSPAEVV